LLLQPQIKPEEDAEMQIILKNVAGDTLMLTPRRAGDGSEASRAWVSQVRDAQTPLAGIYLYSASGGEYEFTVRLDDLKKAVRALE